MSCACLYSEVSTFIIPLLMQIASSMAKTKYLANFHLFNSMISVAQSNSKHMALGDAIKSHLDDAVPSPYYHDVTEGKVMGFV